jgi:ATP-dependent DNA ligase
MSDSNANDMADLKRAIMTLEELEATPKGKAEILAAQKNNEFLYQLFHMSLGQDVYHITLKEDISSAEGWPLALSWERFCQLTQDLKLRMVTGQEAVEAARRTLAHCPERVRKWFIRVINRDLRVGVGRSLVEEAFGRSVLKKLDAPTAQWFYRGCMCAKTFDKAVTAKKPLVFPVAAEPKLDGERAQLFWVPTEDKVYCFSRGGKAKTEIEKTGAFVQQVKDFARKLHVQAGLAESDGVYLDGEFLSSDWNSTASVVSRTKNFDPGDFLKKVRVVLWDWASMEGYQAGEFSWPWKKRKELLMRAAGLNRPKAGFTQVSSNLQVVGHVIIKNQQELDDLYAKSLDLNFEGLMVKKLDSPHVFHRKHEFIVKLKPEDAKTGTIVAVLPGEGANAAATAEDLATIKKAMQEYGLVQDDGYFLRLKVDIGAGRVLADLQRLINDSVDRRLACQDNVIQYRYSERMGRLVVESDRQTFKVGGGFKYRFDQDDRMEFWRRRQELIGMKIDFKAQAGNTATVVARHNRFVRLREDL